MQEHSLVYEKNMVSCFRHICPGKTRRRIDIRCPLKEGARVSSVLCHLSKKVDQHANTTYSNDFNEGTNH